MSEKRFKTYSVLQIGIVTQNGGYGLYDSQLQACIFTGSQDEMYALKHKLEDLQQKEDNNEHRRQLLKEWTDIIVKSGQSEQQAEQFLKEKLPYLYEQV